MTTAARFLYLRRQRVSVGIINLARLQSLPRRYQLIAGADNRDARAWISPHGGVPRAAQSRFRRAAGCSRRQDNAAAELPHPPVGCTGPPMPPREWRLRPPRFRLFNRNTASAPGGSGAPVIIRSAVPASARERPVPRQESPMTGRVIGMFMNVGGAHRKAVHAAVRKGRQVMGRSEVFRQHQPSASVSGSPGRVSSGAILSWDSGKGFFVSEHAGAGVIPSDARFPGHATHLPRGAAGEPG